MEDFSTFLMHRDRAELVRLYSNLNAIWLFPPNSSPFGDGRLETFFSPVWSFSFHIQAVPSDIPFVFQIWSFLEYMSPKDREVTSMPWCDIDVMSRKPSFSLFQTQLLFSW